MYLKSWIDELDCHIKDRQNAIHKLKQTREGIQQDRGSLWEELEKKKIFYYPLTNLVEEERIHAQRKIEKQNTIQTEKNFRSKG